MKSKRRSRQGTKRRKSRKVFVGGDFTDAQLTHFRTRLAAQGYPVDVQEELLGKIHTLITDLLKRQLIGVNDVDNVANLIINNLTPDGIRHLFNQFLDIVEDTGSVAEF
jgi:hypothetical protein